MLVPAMTGAQLADSVRASVRARVEHGWTPGMVVGVVDSSGSHFFSAGSTSMRGGNAVDEQTIFEIGSVTKLFTTLLLTAMASRGEVELDEPVSALLPDSVHVPQRDSVITLRMLALHRSGLPDLPPNWVSPDSANPYAAYDSVQLYAFLRDYSLPRAPGTRFVYSNLGSGLLGFALARHARMSYEELLRARVLEPLGLRRTGISRDSAALLRSARGHTESGETPDWQFDALAGAGALRSTAADLAVLLRAIIDRHSQVDSAIALTLPTTSRTALGWNVRRETGSTILYVGGRTGGFRSFIGVNLSARRGVVALTNSGMGVDDLGFHMLTRSTPLIVVRESITLPFDSLRSYVGEYASTAGQPVLVRLDGNQLVAQVGGLGHANIYPSKTDEFFARLANVQLAFTRDGTGRVSGLTLYVNGRGTAAQRNPVPPGVELIYSEPSAAWFEDAGVHGDLSADGRWLLLGDWRHRKVIDVRTGGETTLEAVAPTHGLDRLFGLLRVGTNRRALYGVRGEERGWFLEDAAGPVYTGLPPSASVAWSSDGRRLAYFIGSGDTLFVRTDGGERAVPVGRPAAPPIWAPDGSAVYVLVSNQDGAGALLRVRPDVGAVDTLRNGLYISTGVNRVAVSSRGDLLFLALADSTEPRPETRHDPTADRDLDIYALELGSGALRPFAQTRYDEFAPAIVNGHLYWTRNAYADAVVILRAGGGEPHTKIENAVLPSWGPQGRRLAFTHGGGGADGALSMDAAVVELDADGSPVGQSTPIVAGLHEDFTPAWSPDGSWIAYHSHRSTAPVPYYAGEGTTDDLYIRRPDAPMQTEIRLTDFGWEVGTADWSPDGRQLVFDSWERGGRPGVSKPWIATIDPATGGLLGVERLLLPKGIDNATMAAWSPAGDEIALDVRLGGERHELWMVRVDGSGAEKLFEFESRTYGGLDWTPDARAIVVSALTDGRMQLFRIDRATRQMEQLTRDAANLLHPKVSPDGRWIAASRLVRTKEIWRTEIPQ
ncbi:MAG TPA: serine hydrolase [Gemmatimonadaceae bacterium]|nr:serine hydrolase [Gemmatimonadaceae bacterium]